MKLRWMGALCAAGIAGTALAASSTTLLKTSSTWDGSAIDYSKARCPEVDAVVVDIPPNGVTPIHLHPVNNYAYVLEGQVTVEEGDVAAGALAVKKSATFKKGDAFAEVVNTWHRGTAGPEGVKILVWYTSEMGQPFTVAYSPDYRIERASKEASSCAAGTADVKK